MMKILFILTFMATFACTFDKNITEVSTNRSSYLPQILLIESNYLWSGLQK